jgi:plastocyanin
LRKLWFAGSGAVLVASAVTGFALAGRSAGGPVIKTLAIDKVAINQYLQVGDRFSPGTTKVKSGETLTFEYGSKDDEPHTLTIVPAAKLPKTLAQVFHCRVCEQYATPHLKNPKAEPSEKNPIIHWTLDKGQPGLDTVGDSLAIQPGAHKSIKAVVSAPAGTTLAFVCAVHPWMQGKIEVTS